MLSNIKFVKNNLHVSLWHATTYAIHLFSNVSVMPESSIAHTGPEFSSQSSISVIMQFMGGLCALGAASALNAIPGNLFIYYLIYNKPKKGMVHIKFSPP